MVNILNRTVTRWLHHVNMYYDIVFQKTRHYRESVTMELNQKLA